MKDLFGDKVERAIELLRMYQPKDTPYYGCFSGGKDSCVIKEIARLGEINVVWHYNVTTIDPPELCRFIKREHKDVVWEVPLVPFFKKAMTEGYPIRNIRWCCRVYKESRAPIGEVMIFGVRAAESPRRAKRWKEVSAYTATQAYVISPIFYWQDDEVWRFIKSRNIPYCELYDKGFSRIGCVGCPMSSNRAKELKLWPHFERAWMKLFEDLWHKRSGKPQRDGRRWFGDRHFSCWMEMWEWWLNETPLPNDDECQGILDMYS
jgi:phosphoadenosine phosphosulfate reductase